MEKVAELKLKLTRPAKKQGGDRYECGKKGEPDITILINLHRISRPLGNEVLKELTITVSH